MPNDEYREPNPELCSPSHLYNRSDAREIERPVLQPSDHEYEPDLAELQELDPESYRMVVYSWA